MRMVKNGRKDIKDWLNDEGIACSISSYGRNSILQVKSKNLNIYLLQSNLDDGFGFFNVSVNVINNLQSDKMEYFLAFLNTTTDRMYVYNESQAQKLLSNCSVSNKVNYKINEVNLTNELDIGDFGELIYSL